MAEYITQFTNTFEVKPEMKEKFDKAMENIKYKPLVLYTFGNIISAKVRADLEDAVYVNTRYDKGMGNIRGMRFSEVIVLDYDVSEEYINYAKQRVIKENKC